MSVWHPSSLQRHPYQCRVQACPCMSHGSCNTSHITLTQATYFLSPSCCLKPWAFWALSGSRFLLVEFLCHPVSGSSLCVFDPFHLNTKPKQWVMGLQLSNRLLSSDTQGPEIDPWLNPQTTFPISLKEKGIHSQQKPKASWQKPPYRSKRRRCFSCLGAILNRDQKMS